MTYDISRFWFALLIAFALGYVLGPPTHIYPEAKSFIAIGRGARGLIAGAVLFASGLALALLHAVVGRPGLWLETALLAVAAWAVGCTLSSAVELSRTRSARSTSGAPLPSTGSLGRREQRSAALWTPAYNRIFFPASAVALLSALILGAAWLRRRSRADEERS